MYYLQWQWNTFCRRNCSRSVSRYGEKSMFIAIAVVSLCKFQFFFLLFRSIFFPLGCNQFAAVCLWCDVLWFYWFFHFSEHFVNKWLMTIVYRFIGILWWASTHRTRQKKMEANRMVCAIFTLRHSGKHDNESLALNNVRSFVVAVDNMTNFVDCIK